MTQNPNFTTTRIRVILVIVLSFCLSVAYAKLPLFDTNPLYAKIELIKPGMSKYEVKSILKQPYKLSFYTNDKQDYVEELFYKAVYIYYENFYITYRIVFVNDKVTALLQEENLYKDQKIEVVKKE